MPLVAWLLSPLGPLLPPPPDAMTFLALRHAGAGKGKGKRRAANPGQHHLPRATAKQNRMYAKIKASELDRGMPLAEAKSIAAATVRKYQKRRRA